MKYVMLFALLLAPLAFAEGRFYEIKENGLDAALDNVACKTELMVGVMESLMEHVDGADSLSDNVDELEADVSELTDIAESGDALEFRRYVYSVYTPNMAEARLEVVNLRNAPGISLQTKLELKEDYDKLFSEYMECNGDSLKRWANAKVDAYERALEVAESDIRTLSSKGVDTSELSDLVSDAKSDIVEPLQDEIDEADTAAEVRVALSHYCLFNGCPQGKNFHFASKFGYWKLAGLLDVVDERAEAAGLSDLVSEARESLSDADSLLDSIGDDDYEGTEGRELWNALHDATMKIREIVSKLRAV